MTQHSAEGLPPFTRYQVEPGVIHMTLPPPREPEWIRCVGTIEGLHAIKYRASADVEHDAAISRLVREFDGATWLEAHGLKCISVIVEFTENGANHWGKPIKTPAQVAHSRIDHEGQINVSSHVPLEVVGPLAADDREQFWFDWYGEIVAVLSRRRKLGVPRRRSTAEMAAMPAEPNYPVGEPDDDDPPLVLEVHLPLGRGRSSAASGTVSTWMASAQELVAALDDPVTLGSEGQEGDEYVFRLTGAESHAVLAAAGSIAALPGVPPGAYALFVDGAGLPDPGFQLPLNPEMPPE